MNRTNAFAAIALMTFAATVHAQTARKEVILDAGKGGIELKVSVPEKMAGPMDFSGNDGIGGGGEITANGVTFYGKEAKFSGKLGETGRLIYLTTVGSTTSNTSKFSNDGLAKEILLKTGQKLADAKRIETTNPLIDDGVSVTYSVCGKVVYEKYENVNACSIVQTSVSKDSKKSASILVTATERDLDRYNENPSKYSNGTAKMFEDVIGNSKARMK
jgi:hypothetical protein